MDAECFNCRQPAARRSTIVIDADRTFENKAVCQSCRSSFDEDDLIELRHTVRTD